MTHTDLIEKLSKLDGPCRECDALIAAELFICPDFDINQFKPEYHKAVEYGVYKSALGWVSVSVAGDIKIARECEPYTASIDSALTLVPRKYRPAMHPYEDCQHPSRWDVYMMENSNIHHSRFDGAHEHLPIAICIASLRAIEAMEGE